jgi:hypothetical protein
MRYAKEVTPNDSSNTHSEDLCLAMQSQHQQHGNAAAGLQEMQGYANLHANSTHKCKACCIVVFASERKLRQPDLRQHLCSQIW